MLARALRLAPYAAAARKLQPAARRTSVFRLDGVKFVKQRCPLTPEMDMCGATRDVRFVPKADIRQH